ADNAWELTVAQKQLLLLAQSDPAASVAYNVPVAFELLGSFDIERLERAFRHVTGRHETLRSRIEAETGLQRSSASTLERPKIPDLSKLALSEREKVLESLIASECGHKFDLANGPLFRYSLIQLEQERRVLLINAHHIAIDGWSMGLVI